MEMSTLPFYKLRQEGGRKEGRQSNFVRLKYICLNDIKFNLFFPLDLLLTSTLNLPSSQILRMISDKTGISVYNFSVVFFCIKCCSTKKQEIPYVNRV